MINLEGVSHTLPAFLCSSSVHLQLHCSQILLFKMQLQYRTRVWYYWLHWDTMASFKLSNYFSSGCFQTFEHSFCLIEIAVRCSKKKKENMCYSHSTSLITSNKIICRLICLLISLSGHNATQYELFGSGLIIRFFSWGAHDEMWMWRASGSPVKFCLLIACP